MKKYLMTGIAAFAVLFGVWYFASPGYTISNMREAAVEGDVDTFTDYIDFPSLRESAKSQLKAQMVQEMQKEDNPMAGLGMALGIGMIDPMVDGLLSPETMRAMMLQKAKDDVEAGARVEPSDEADWEIERTSFDEFRIMPSTPDSVGPAPSIIFKRDGLGWKLSEMDLSEMKLGQ